MKNTKIIVYSIIIIAVLLIAFNLNKITGQSSRAGQISQDIERKTLKTYQTSTYILPEKTIIIVSPEVIYQGQKITIIVTPKEGESLESEFSLYQLRAIGDGTKEIFKDSESIPSIGPKILNKQTTTTYRIGSNIDEGLYKIGFKIKGTGGTSEEIIYSNEFEIKEWKTTK